MVDCKNEDALGVKVQRFNRIALLEAANTPKSGYDVNQKGVFALSY